MTLRYLLRAAGLTALLAAAIDSAYSQGTFPPPAGPAVPAMKTLQQIEPRVDLLNSAGSNGVNTDSTHQFIITAPGSYYLSSPMVVTKANGILINSSAVTLDLNGFEISRADAASGNGIEIGTGVGRYSISNGSIRAFANGVATHLVSPFPRGGSFDQLRFINCSIGLQTGNYVSVSHCSAMDCGLGIFSQGQCTLSDCTSSGGTGVAGIQVDDGSSITRCTVGQQTSGYGIRLGNNCTASDCAVGSCACNVGIQSGAGTTLSNCTVSYNTVNFGFFATNGDVLSNCTASFNTSSVPFSAGFRSDGSCTLSQCSSTNQSTTTATPTIAAGQGFNLAAGSSLQSCIADNNKGDGIDVNNSTVRQCTVIGNNGYGISATLNCNIAGCTVSGNNQSGIHGDNGGSIVDCTANSNFIAGILVDTAGKYDVRNNNCEGNGVSSGLGAGIQIKGPFTRVDGNHVSVNFRGIEVIDGVVGVYVVRNAAALNNDVNYKIANGNKVGTIVSAPASGAINGSTGGSGVGSTDPWVNVSY
jgi:hypothetical protein